MSITNILTIEKETANALANPQTLFLAPSNSTLETKIKFVTKILSEQHSQIAIINGYRVALKIYQHMAVIITENKYIFFLILLSFNIFYSHFLHT